MGDLVAHLPQKINPTVPRITSVTKVGLPTASDTVQRKQETLAGPRKKFVLVHTERETRCNIKWNTYTSGNNSNGGDSTRSMPIGLPGWCCCWTVAQCENTFVTR